MEATIKVEALARGGFVARCNGCMATDDRPEATPLRAAQKVALRACGVPRIIVDDGDELFRSLGIQIRHESSEQDAEFYRLEAPEF